MISSLILSGASVATLFILWLGTHQNLPRTFKLIQFVDEHGENFPIGSEELDTPQLAELSDAPLHEPVVELSTLLSRDVVAVAAQIRTDSIKAVGHRNLDDRPVGPRGRKQLDYFGIELGGVGGKRQVDYAAKLATSKPLARSGEGSAEGRLYLTWRGGKLEALDRGRRGQLEVDDFGQPIEQIIA